MKALATALSTAVIAIFALPGAALAEYLVPPGNSAVNQYTEAVPTAGGHRNVDKGNDKSQPSPKQVLGAKNTRRLEAQGQQGREAAEVAAATAPSPPVETAPEASEEDSDSAGGGGKRGNSGGGKAAKDGGASARAEQPTAGSNSFDEEAAAVEGSSGLGEILAQATGSSSGEMGLLLPLIILGAAAWALAFFRRQRKQPTA
jgi:hypothetical protein